MFLNHLLNRAIGMSFMLYFMHFNVSAQVVQIISSSEGETLQEFEQLSHLENATFLASSVSVVDEELCAILINQAELQAQNHLGNGGRVELVVVDNAVSRTMICPLVFDRPIKLMKREEIQRAGISAYIEFEDVTFQEPHLANAKYKLICTKGCSSWQYDLKLKIYEGTSNWAIIQNASAPINVEPTNK